MSDQKEIARIELNDTDRLVISTSQYRGKEYVDIRKFVESENYTGPTKQGVRFSTDLLAEVVQSPKKATEDLGIAAEE
jgi:menaquinone-dependent protoporphyrinogen IX oxidase